MKARELFEMGAAPVAPPKPGVRPGIRPSAPPRPGKFPSPSRRKFPGKREKELPKPKAVEGGAAMPGSLAGSYTPSGGRMESRASLIVKRLLA